MISQIREKIDPVFLGGFTFPQWIKLLKENRFDVDRKFFLRALIATTGTLVTSSLKVLEPHPQLDANGEHLLQSPVFILGLPRSGTTHLFSLLAKDPQFAFPTRIDCYNAHTFLFLHRIGIHRILGLIPSKKRVMDNVQTGWLSPEEDNIALTILAGTGSRLMQVFLRNESYRNWLEADGGLNETQRTLFIEALIQFSRKLVFLKRARPLFKSPAHTARIPEILHAFPNAKFVTIFRHPFHQFASQKAMQTSTSRTWSALQENRPITDEERLGLITLTLKRYLETRECIPPNQLCEIHYEDLVREEDETLTKIYSSLNLDSPPKQPSSGSDSVYQTNKHPDLPIELQNMIRQAYAPFSSLNFFQPIS
jgi:hypothetical protein